MLAIKVNEEWLDLNPKTQANITMNNPIFDRESVSRVFSYPFKLPATPRNRNKLKHVNRLDVRPEQTELPAQLWIQGVMFEEGILEVTGGTKETITVVFKNIPRQFVEDLDKFYINDILDNTSIPRTVPARSDYTLGDPPGLYLFTINGVNLSYNSQPGDDMEDVQINLAAEINGTYPGLAGYTPSTNQFHLETTTLEELVVTHSINIAFVSQKTVSESKMESFMDFFEDTITTPLTEASFPVVQSSDFYKGLNPDFQQYINFYHPSGNILNTFYTATPGWEHTFVPYIRIPYLLSKIAENAGATSIDGVYDDSDFQELILHNNYAIDEVSDEEIVGAGTQYLNHYKTSIDFNDHVPRMKGRAFFSALMRSLNLYYEVGDQTVTLKNKIIPLQQIPINWTDRAEVDYDMKRKKDNGFTLRYAEDETDNASVQDEQIIGAGEEIIELEFGALNTIKQTNLVHSTNEWKHPYSWQTGSSDELELGKNKYSFRLFFDRGLQPDSNSNNYLMATHDTQNYDDTEIGELALTIAGAKGMYEKHWKGYLEKQNAPIANLPIRLYIQDILELRSWKNPMRLIESPKGDFVGIVKTVQFKVSSKGISIAKVAFVL